MAVGGEHGDVANVTGVADVAGVAVVAGVAPEGVGRELLAGEGVDVGDKGTTGGEGAVTKGPYVPVEDRSEDRSRVGDGQYREDEDLQEESRVKVGGLMGGDGG